MIFAFPLLECKGQFFFLLQKKISRGAIFDCLTFFSFFHFP